MSSIQIKKTSIVDLDTDCIVNAANEGLWAGSGVCGAIFHAAGHDKLKQVCDAIGHCDTGSAVITPGFRLKARYIIHAVGPIWNGGKFREEEKLYCCYQRSLELAMENNCQSIGFPLISSGIFGYPREQAWKVAIRACRDFLNNHADYELNIVFAVISQELYDLGMAELA